MKTVSALCAMTLSLLTLAASANEAMEYPHPKVHEVPSALFNEFRNIESISHKERIAILQEAESCIQAATNREQYRSCEEREKAARQQSNEKAKASHQALSARFAAMRPPHTANRAY